MPDVYALYKLTSDYPIAGIVCKISPVNSAETVECGLRSWLRITPADNLMVVQRYKTMYTMTEPIFNDAVFYKEVWLHVFSEPVLSPVQLEFMLDIQLTSTNMELHIRLLDDETMQTQLDDHLFDDPHTILPFPNKK